jgi:hypothetical protein
MVMVMQVGHRRAVVRADHHVHLPEDLHLGLPHALQREDRRAILLLLVARTRAAGRRVRATHSLSLYPSYNIHTYIHTYIQLRGADDVYNYCADVAGILSRRHLHNGAGIQTGTHTYTLKHTHIHTYIHTSPMRHTCVVHRLT